MGEIEQIIESEIKINLSTGDGQVSFKTPKIIGFLDSVIIDSKNKVEVILESSLGYLIFKGEIEGIKYVAPRVKILPPEFNARDMLTFDKFKINEKLLITVLGPKNTDIKIILRLS